MKKYLVTSGCSFSDNVMLYYKDGSGRWPHFLANAIDYNLINYGVGSAGNDYISNSLIYALQNLLNQKVDPNNILAVVMWSGIDRQGQFISKSETYNFDDLLNPGSNNPVNYLKMKQYPSEGSFIPDNNIDRGWLLGSPYSGWENKNIVEFKNTYTKQFYTYENSIFNSFNNFLQLQWFCKIKNIKLKNLTFTKILTDEVLNYPTPKYLYQMIDFDNWIFYGDRQGLYEYTINNNLPFYDDKFHPTPGAHKHFVENFLLQALQLNI